MAVTPLPVDEFDAPYLVRAPSHAPFPTRRSLCRVRDNSGRLQRERENARLSSAASVWAGVVPGLLVVRQGCGRLGSEDDFGVSLRAAGIEAFGEDVELLELPEPPPLEAGEVLIEVRAAGV